MKFTIIGLVLICVLLQYRLWVGEGSLAAVHRLQKQIEIQERENARLQAQNSRLAAQVAALRDGDAAIEARAREELGLIKEGETYFLFVEDAKAADKAPVKHSEESQHDQ